MPLKYIRDTINWNMAHLPIAKKKKKFYRTGITTKIIDQDVVIDPDPTYFFLLS